jgi:replicative DNA helicase
MAFNGGLNTNQPAPTPFNKQKPKNVRSVSEIFKDVKVGIVDATKNGPRWGLRTGYGQIDDLTFGLFGGRVYTIAGRPGSGKTALQNEICVNVALTGEPVLLFSMEMNGEDLVERLIANKLGITIYQQRMGMTPPNKVEELEKFVEKLENMKFEICDASGVTVAKMIEIVEWFKDKHGVYPKLVGTDYIQLMKASGQQKDVRTDLVAISTAIVDFSRTYNVPVLQVAQCSRKCEDREDKRPLMSDLAESGQIEQDSWAVAFVYRDEYYNKNSKFKGVAELIFRKNRSGQTKTLMLGYVGEQFKFTNNPPIVIDEEEEEKIKKGWHPFMED